MKKAIFIFLMAFIIILTMAAFTSCGDSDNPADDTKSGDSANGDNESADETPPAPALLTPIGTLIGSEGGWSQDGAGNPETGRAAAFDGDVSTFFDPPAGKDPAYYCGIKMDKPYILTEIRIHPRGDQLARFNGASIWGTNDDAFDTATATQIWVSGAAADAAEWQVIPDGQFNGGANAGFTHFIYFNEAEHGDVAEIELYGVPK